MLESSLSLSFKNVHFQWDPHAWHSNREVWLWIKCECQANQMRLAVLLNNMELGEQGVPQLIRFSASHYIILEFFLPQKQASFLLLGFHVFQPPLLGEKKN